MTVSFDLPQFIAALGYPESAAVNQRIPKKMLVETGAPTAADKRAITDGIDDIHWLAALKPVTVGIPAYQDEVRDYLEIAILSIKLRPEAKASRIAELVHRAIPYPTFLMAHSQGGISISLVHKRWAQNEAGKTVLDGDVLEANLRFSDRPGLVQSFVDALSLEKQPRLSLHALYQGWIDALIAWQASALTGCFELSTSAAHAAMRRTALHQCRELDAKIASLRLSASKEKQTARQVAANLEIKALLAERQRVADNIKG